MSELTHGVEEFDEFEKSYKLSDTVIAIVYEDGNGNEYALHGIGYLPDHVDSVEDAVEVAKNTGDSIATVFGFTRTDRTHTLKAGSEWRNDIVKKNPNFNPEDFLSILFGDVATHYQAMKL